MSTAELNSNGESDKKPAKEKDATGSYSDQQEDSADEKRCASYGMSCDDINLDIITISRWLSADEAKRKRRSDVVLRFSRWISADDFIGDVIIFSRWFEQPVASYCSSADSI
ncbi:hypothetical protein F511_44657 [Dorcoceras hygrometricum]|uniref:Uncharacterized protein n=1 Tax=Dorcoceras hygrometricum TaxID=472368 RepID=A0A2Z6ZXP8_9LAMI|nr:hypothetical protein F511_44657 [Dorcoceras hygrometricum]